MAINMIIIEFLYIIDTEYSFVLKQHNQLLLPLHFNNILNFQKEPFDCMC